jgi:phospholipid/cholesterol/gamma-HCH transport system ATP-binding protein
MAVQNDKEPIIEVRNVAKSFEGRVVLENINLAVRRGETVAIMGGSGCGKTTLLRLLMGVYTCDKGEVLLFGRDIAKMSRDELNQVRKRFGIVFQMGALYNSMTVGENVALPLKEHTELDDKIIEIMVKMKLELVGLRGFENFMPAQISGGMQKRVGLARAIVLDPEILFYDEPTAGLDPIMSGVITQLILDLNKKIGVTSVVVTHDRECAFKTSNRIAMMYAGKILQEGTPEEIQHTTNPWVQQFIKGAPDGPIPLRQSSKKYFEDLVGD